jgi:hypothetical protein
MQRLRWYIIAAAILLVAGFAGYTIFAPGVRVTVLNTGKTPLREVTVHVTGRSYALGDIPPGHFSGQKVSPTSKSHFEVEFTDEQGKRVRHSAGGYLEASCRGYIDIEIRDGQVVNVKNQVRLGIN